MATKFSYFILILLAITSCKTPSSNKVVHTISKEEDSLTVKDMSIISLVSDPALYDGKKIRVIGYLNLEFEGNAIYLHKEDYILRVSKNAVWLNIPKDMHFKSYQHINKRYVILEGKFNMSDNGHDGSFSGSINNITRLEPWSYKHF